MSKRISGALVVARYWLKETYGHYSMYLRSTNVHILIAGNTHKFNATKDERKNLAYLMENGPYVDFYRALFKIFDRYDINDLPRMWLGTYELRMRGEEDFIALTPITAIDAYFQNRGDRKGVVLLRNGMGMDYDDVDEFGLEVKMGVIKDNSEDSQESGE